MAASGDSSASAAPERPGFTALGVRRGAIEILPVAAYVIPFGIAFGVAATAKGMSPDISVFMSFIVYAGASQFAALDLWQAPLPLLMLALTVFAVNARHILLGAGLAPWLLQVPFGGRFAALVLLSDANFAQAMAARERGELDAGILFGSAIVMWSTWLAGTAIGAYGGAYLGDLTLYGFDAVMITYFAAVVVGQWRGTRDLVPWVVAAGVALACSWLLPPGWHIIVGALAGGIAGAVQHGR